MSIFREYTYLEEKTEAIESTPEAQPAITEALMRELRGELLATMEAVYDTTTKCYTYTFRYKVNTVPSVLTPGDYLVRLNAGNYVVRKKVDFLSEYMDLTADTPIPVDQQQTVLQAYAAIAQTACPDLGPITANNLTDDLLDQIAQCLQDWRNPANNVVIPIMGKGLTNPLELHRIIRSFETAPYVNEDTTIALDLSAGAIPNQFNYIGLQQLIGEIRKLDQSTSERITSITLLGAVPPSVTPSLWTEFCTDVMMVTGIINADRILK